MARRKRFAAVGPTPSHAVASMGDKGSKQANQAGGMRQLWQVLTAPRRTNDSIKPQELTFILSTLSTLVGNGVPLPKALATLAMHAWRLIDFALTI